MDKKGTKDPTKPICSVIRKLSSSQQSKLNLLCNQLLKCSSQMNFNEPLPSQWENQKNIYHLLTTIIEIQSELKIPLPERNNEKFDRFTSWAVQNGAVIRNVSISQFEGYDYGIRADKNIKKDEMIIRIPRCLMLTAQNVVLSPLRDLYCNNVVLQQMPNVALAMLLIVERFRNDNRSFWADYIEVLPSQYSLPMYYDLSDFEELRGSPVFESSLKLCKNIARQYAYFRNIFQTGKDKASEILRDIFTYEQYRWAVATVMTRQNYVLSGDQTKQINALIPFWDICNHSENKVGVSQTTTDYNLDLECSTCTAFQDFKAGEQVFIYYGVRPNADFVVHNGFFYPDNRNDQIFLKFGISRTDAHYPLRTDMLKQLGLLPSGEFVVKDNESEPFNPILLAFLRIFKMSPVYLDFFLVNEPMFSLLKAPFFKFDQDLCPCHALEYLLKLDVEVLTYLQTRITILIRSYSTTAQEDTEILEKNVLSDIRRLIVQQRLQEKHILHKASEYCLKMIKQHTAEAKK